MSGLPTGDSDAGMTLVELVIYLAVGAVVMTVLGGLFVTSWQTDSTTRDRDTATGAAHVISNSVQSAIRNASAFRIDDNMLRARVAVGSSGWECQAWRVSNRLSVGGQYWYELQHKRSSTAITAASPGWRDLLDGFENAASERLLVQGVPTADRPFSAQDRLLKLRLKVVAANTHTMTLTGEPVSISADVVREAVGEGTPSTCW